MKTIRLIHLFIVCLLFGSSTVFARDRHPLVGKWQLQEASLVVPPRDMPLYLLPRLADLIKESEQDSLEYEFASDGSYVSSCSGDFALKGYYALKRQQISLLYDGKTEEKYRIEALAADKLVITVSKDNGLKIRYIFVKQL